jgi:hypothetical protein
MELLICQGEANVTEDKALTVLLQFAAKSAGMKRLKRPLAGAFCCRFVDELK